MKAGVVVTARGRSRRLPGKHLLDLGGKPLIGRLVERLGDLYPVVVATVPDYHELREWAIGAKVGLWYSSEVAEEDVVGRVAAAARMCHFDPVVIVHGDSPFIDERMIREAVRYYQSLDLELLWNTSPSGFRWKVVSGRVLEAMGTPREHVLGGLIKALPLRAKPVTHWLTKVKLSVDTEEDLDFTRKVGEEAGWGAPADDIIRAAIHLSHRADVRAGNA